MTKKAAKKKQSRKQAPKKKSAAKKAAQDAEAPASGEKTQDSPGDGAEKPSEIPMVREEAEAAPQRSNRVVRPEGGKGRDGRDGGGRKRSGSGRRGGGRRNDGNRPKVDQDELGRKAWKVFQHEIAEEGLALIDENSARALAEKSIVVTRAFLEERERRLAKAAGESRGSDQDRSKTTPDGPAEENPSGQDD